VQQVPPIPLKGAVQEHRVFVEMGLVLVIKTGRYITNMGNGSDGFNKEKMNIVYFVLSISPSSA
jgi:hypothetical protein